MRKLIVAASAAALFATISAASAAEVTGTISAIDEASHTITLDGGQTFAVANVSTDATGGGGQTAVESSFKPGDRVRVVYSELDGKMTATQVSPAM